MNSTPTSKGLPTIGGDCRDFRRNRFAIFDEKKSDRPLVLGDRVEIAPAPKQSQLAFYRAVYERQRR